MLDMLRDGHPLSGVVLEELHGWEHETALIKYLESHPELCERLELETVPDNRHSGAIGTRTSQMRFARLSRKRLAQFSSEIRTLYSARDSECLLVLIYRPTFDKH